MTPKLRRYLQENGSTWDMGQEARLRVRGGDLATVQDQEDISMGPILLPMTISTAAKDKDNAPFESRLSSTTSLPNPTASMEPAESSARQ